VGNVYVNRNMIGAVVGVQPFGGEGLSGTGPKAGGPHYLYRFCAEQTLTINTAAAGGNAELLAGQARQPALRREGRPADQLLRRDALLRHRLRRDHRDPDRLRRRRAHAAGGFGREMSNEPRRPR
jgi:hypothetical protein